MNVAVLPFSKEEKEMIENLQIEYVFQPIFYPDGESIFAREALIRSKKESVTELIEFFKKEGKLHLLEVLSFFGATEYQIKNNFSEPITINSFPNEKMEESELKAYEQAYPNRKGKAIVEIMEFPEVKESVWEAKKEAFQRQEGVIALNDFGAGNNGMRAVDTIEPSIVKLSRNAFIGIDKDELKRKRFMNLLKLFHERKIMVVGEGIETKEEFDTLLQCGVDLFQGYYLAMPQ